MFKIRSRIHVVPIGEILYLEKYRKQIRAHTEKGDHVFYARFDDVMPDLDVRFSRCHRSYVLNYDRVVYMGDYVIRMDDSSELFFGKPTILRIKKDYESYMEWKRKKLREIDLKTGYFR